MAQIYFFRHTDGKELYLKKGMISSRLRSIVNESTSFERREKAKKLHVGPTRPRPGPTLLMQVRDAMEGGGEIQLVERDDQRGKENDHVGKEEEGNGDGILLHALPVERDGTHFARVQDGAAQVALEPMKSSTMRET